MAHSDQDYGRQIQQLLPPGPAFTRDPSTETGKLATALGAELSRMDTSAEGLVVEGFPGTTNELLADWERTAGLPDPAIPTPTTIAARLAALQARLISIGGQYPAYFISIAAAFGYAATITTHTPFAADVSHADDLLYDELSRFWWEMNVSVPIGTPTPVIALEHAVRRQIQDHTYVTFNYSFH